MPTCGLRVERKPGNMTRGSVAVAVALLALAVAPVAIASGARHPAAHVHAVQRHVGWRWPLGNLSPALKAAARTLLSASPGHGYAPHIIGGSDAVQGQWGFMAFIVYFNSSGNPLFACSGMLVSANVVLTAGHCSVDESTGQPFDPSGYRVVTGAVDWTDTIDRQVSDASQTIIDPNFDPTTADNDAALLVLSAPVSSPTIPLWASGQLAAGTGALIAGWGDTYVGEPFGLQTLLQWAPTVAQSVAYCSAEAPLGYLYDPATELCAVNAPTFDTGTCNDDSGGPLLVQGADGNPVEAEITSVGRTDCDTITADYFTSILPIEAWIAAEVSAASPPPPPPTTTTTTAPPPTTTPTTSTNAAPPTLPTMTKASARSYVHQVLAGVFRQAFRLGNSYRVSCSRVSATRFNCGVTFSSGPNDYYGNVIVFYELGTDGKLSWSDRYTARWVNDYCYFHSGHRRSCNVRARHGTF